MDKNSSSAMEFFSGYILLATPCSNSAGVIEDMEMLEDLFSSIFSITDSNFLFIA
jgi:hypothetical protein